tara:strand:+ start:1233 stop:1673 length:441 start_codon:yes stop_codon:yes gene_type:complete
MELTDEEKATLAMMGMSEDDYKKQFPEKNEVGQSVNFAGQTLDDFYISMLDANIEYDFPNPKARNEGLGSVRPASAPVPTFSLPDFSGAMSLVLELPEMQEEALEDAYLYATDQGKLKKQEFYQPATLYQMTPQQFDIKRKKKKDD